MKKVLFFVILIAAACTANCQQLLFNVNQSASAYKSGNTTNFPEAEVNDIEGTILVQNNTVVVDGNTKANYTLTKKEAQTKIHDNIISYSYSGKDDKNVPISFIYTVNLNSKEAVVEVGTNELKTFYFGTYSSFDFTATGK